MCDVWSVMDEMTSSSKTCKRTFIVRDVGPAVYLQLAGAWNDAWSVTWILNIHRNLMVSSRENRVPKLINLVFPLIQGDLSSNRQHDVISQALHGCEEQRNYAFFRQHSSRQGMLDTFYVCESLLCHTFLLWLELSSPGSDLQKHSSCKKWNIS